MTVFIVVWQIAGVVRIRGVFVTEAAALIEARECERIGLQGVVKIFTEKVTETT